MKCCIEIKYCLGVAITTKCDGFFVFKLKKDALLRERPVNNIKHINYIIPRPLRTKTSASHRTMHLLENPSYFVLTGRGII